VVTPEDISAIAAYIGADADHFVNRYCRRSGRRYVLGQREDGYCIFWKKACTIHPVKPRMCRAWPFIPAVLVDEGNWFVMAGSCPGMRTDVSVRQIRIAVERALGWGRKSKIP
jgi:Fe-S-cluster containining protein